MGQSFLTGDATGHAFRWDRKHGLIDLGTLGGDFSSAHAINIHKSMTDLGTYVACGNIK